MSPDFENRLLEVLPSVAEYFGTPFYIYDAKGIDENCRAFNAAFSGLAVREFFAVKALPNPAVLRRLAGRGFGFDCSSLPELTLARQAGASGRDTVFTSNNTSVAELAAATTSGALMNIDDEAVLDTLIGAGLVPRALSFRVNPGSHAPQFDATFFGDPSSSKFGIRMDRLEEVCRRAARAGVHSFGLHMMITSNFLDEEPTLFALGVLADQAIRLRGRLGVEFDTINVGGGMGIPFRPGERPLDLAAVAGRIREVAAGWPSDWHPTICFENGSYITGSHGVLVTRVVNRMSKWREVVGVDVGTNALMRRLVYADAYHHITAPFVASDRIETVDVVGSLCSNLDKLAEQRSLPVVAAGDLLVIHDAGAHGHAMGTTYNGRLRPKELMLHPDRSVDLIRRAETEDDYFATLAFEPQSLRLDSAGLGA
ncbi:diaminopimelate decarboxylase family protein [Actinomadura geliboluensis]|uniref:Diaminopimelate decarboxylase n=1 Tax=Actinomadura geliboluensis TaxID=882440 RepID=A0A5S4HKG7_9ACTN|nr:diaminopimelate decarboxylase [Actinomadura geliboluensis]TMR42330.1 diaminopimelate decarboxylase [Actinomadura geliboluensis]